MTPGTGAAGTAKERQQIADAAKDLRDGKLDEETLKKMETAFDHLFNSGRAFNKDDRDKLRARIVRAIFEVIANANPIELMIRRHASTAIDEDERCADHRTRPAEERCRAAQRADQALHEAGRRRPNQP